MLDYVPQYSRLIASPQTIAETLLRRPLTRNRLDELLRLCKLQVKSRPMCAQGYVKRDSADMSFTIEINEARGIRRWERTLWHELVHIYIALLFGGFPGHCSQELYEAHEQVVEDMVDTIYRDPPMSTWSFLACVGNPRYRFVREGHLDLHGRTPDFRAHVREWCALSTLVQDVRGATLGDSRWIDWLFSTSLDLGDRVPCCSEQGVGSCIRWYSLCELMYVQVELWKMVVHKRLEVIDPDLPKPYSMTAHNVIEWTARKLLNQEPVSTREWVRAQLEHQEEWIGLDE